MRAWKKHLSFASLVLYGLSQPAVPAALATPPQNAPGLELRQEPGSKPLEKEKNASSLSLPQPGVFDHTSFLDGNPLSAAPEEGPQPEPPVVLSEAQYQKAVLALSSIAENFYSIVEKAVQVQKESAAFGDERPEEKISLSIKLQESVGTSIKRVIVIEPEQPGEPVSEEAKEKQRAEIVEELMSALENYVRERIRREEASGEARGPREERIERALQSFLSRVEEAANTAAGFIRERFLPPHQLHPAEPGETRPAGEPHAGRPALLAPGHFLQISHADPGGEGFPEENAKTPAAKSRQYEYLKNTLLFFYFDETRHPWLTILINRHLSESELRFLLSLLEHDYRRGHRGQEKEFSSRNMKEAKLFWPYLVPLSQIIFGERSTSLVQNLNHPGTNESNSSLSDSGTLS